MPTLGKIKLLTHSLLGQLAISRYIAGVTRILVEDLEFIYLQSYLKREKHTITKRLRHNCNLLQDYLLGTLHTINYTNLVEIWY